ncbi:MAG: hypothetical protein H7Z43_14200 [Clostridia bacterium]|nr:hypothetical protein [Deltaproteobacteria bacterium]
MNGPLRIVLFLVFGLLATSCNLNRYGKSIGRPEHDAVSVGATGAKSGIAIVEVYPATSGFVELEGSGLTTRLVLDGYKLESPRGSAPVTGTLAPGGRLSVNFDDATTLLLGNVGVANPAQSGEVALVDSAGVVQAYFAWGVNPTTSALRTRAAASGAAADSILVEVPFPRSATTSVVRDRDHVGCSTPTPGAEADGTGCAVGPQVLFLNEVSGQRNATEVSWMVIENTSAGVLDVTGLRLCHDETCGALPMNALASGGSLRVCLGALTDSDCTVSLASTIAIPPIVEAFVAAPGLGATVSDSGLVDYMRTKLAATTLEEQAVALGYWASDSAPTPTFVLGESLSRNPGTVAPPVWFPARATPVSANLVISRATLWNSCAEPADVSAPVSSVVATNLARASGVMRISNLGSAAINLSNLIITVDGTELLSDTASLTGAFAVGATRDLPAGLNETGRLSIAIRSSGQLIQFVQWGNAASGVSAAVDDNVWPAETCVAPRLATDGSLTLRDVILSRGSGGYSE